MGKNWTITDLENWARENLTDLPKGEYAARGGGFWYVLDGDAATEYACQLALVRTRHCTDCGDFILWVDFTGTLQRPEDVTRGSESPLVEVHDLSTLRLEDLDPEV
jgi:hypothetical protein